MPHKTSLKRPSFSRNSCDQTLHFCLFTHYIGYNIALLLH
ncbi:hypothetical protein AcetOrient_orf01973 [Acetobacter orientalis]|uniref:Uncharacterized protein n=1 Tax=Acetobacter orientalis TaxID=146474 RepID=A0A2Z5ZG46_9PROT|nr:hypothetical protein AcetOrient_orf01973 [Acetobacter orientalis]